MEEYSYNNNNKSYVLYNHKAIISDTKGNQRTVDYYDNLGQVLAIEKEICFLLERKKQIQEVVNLFEEKKKQQVISQGMFILSSVLSPVAISCLFVGENLYETYTGNINVGAAMATGGLIAGGVATYSYWHNYYQHIRAYTLALRYIDEKIESEIKNLENLMQDKKITKMPMDGIFEVSNDYIDEAQRELNNRMELGKNYSKYYRRYKKNTLSKKLEDKGFQENEIRAAEMIMRTTGPKLIKKFISNKKSVQ